MFGAKGSAAQLYATPDNPIPGKPIVATIAAADRFPLRVARWRQGARAPVRGTVCILEGRAEFIEKYFEVVRELRRRGFSVVVFDWRGQGLSGRQVKDGRKGHVRSFADYRLDLETIRDRVLLPHMPKPHFALAHSMGAAIALKEAAEGRLPFERLVATSPMIELSIVKQLKLAARAAFLLRILGFGKSFIPGGGPISIATKPFPGNRLTSDPVRYARNAAAAQALGEGAVGAPTIAWLHGAFRLMKRLSDPRTALNIHVPTLIFAAGADPVCSAPAAERFAARLKSGHAIVLQGSRHELLMERDRIRELFWTAFDVFIPGTLDPTAQPSLDFAPTFEDGEDLPSGQELDGGRVEAPVARSHDRAAARG